jgi:hypothetical protein
MISLLGILDRIGCETVESIIVRTTADGMVATLLCCSRAIDGVTAEQLQELYRMDMLAPHIVGHLAEQGVIRVSIQESGVRSQESE